MNLDRVEEHMTKSPFCAHLTTSVTEAQHLMDQYSIRHLPVVHQGKIVGVVSDRDLNKAQPRGSKIIKLVRDVMIKNPYIAKSTTPLNSIVKVMAENKFGCVLIHDKKGNINGIFTSTDALKLLQILLTTPNFIHRFATVEDVIDFSQIEALSG